MKNKLAFLIVIMAISNVCIAQNVGIGENAPATRLDIKGHTTGDLLNIKTSTGTSRLYVKDDGKVGIGSTDPMVKLDIRGSTGRATDAAFEDLFQLASNNSTNVVLALKFGIKTESTMANRYGAIYLDDNGNPRNLSLQQTGGNVGIGTVSPLTTLHILSPTAATNTVNTEPILRLQRPATANVKWDNIAEFRLGTFATAVNSQSRLDIWMNNGGNATPGHVVTIEARGRVGIATETPGYPLEVSGGINANITTGRFFTTGISNLTEMTPASPQNNIPIAIKANNAIWTTYGFYSSSDSRAKENILSKESTTSLSLINQLNVVQYDWIDKTKQYHEYEEGFIAQEVKKILPLAVSNNKEFIPNIYTLAENVEIHDDIIQLTLNKQYEIITGDILKLYTESGKEYRLSVLAINDKNVLLQQSENKIENVISIFVYGKEVDDFLTVDYDRIFTIGISAIQELSKQIKDLKNENNMLKSEFSMQIESLKEELNVMKNQLPQINTMLSSNKPTTK